MAAKGGLSYTSLLTPCNLKKTPGFTRAWKEKEGGENKKPFTRVADEGL